MTDVEVHVEFLGGKCPVQGEGTVDGKPFYFRARGESWSMSIGGPDVVGAPEWYWEQNYGEGAFDAGWMRDEEAEGFLRAAAVRWRNGEKGMTP